MQSKTLNVIHVFVIVPLLLSVGLLQGKSPNWLFSLLLITGILLVLYHSYRYIETKSMVNVFHLLFIAPLILFIAIKKQQTPSYVFTLLVFVALAALWIHGKKLLGE